MILVYFTLYFTLYRGCVQDQSVDKVFNIYHINEIHLFKVENFEECRNQRQIPVLNHILYFNGPH